MQGKAFKSSPLLFKNLFINRIIKSAAWCTHKSKLASWIRCFEDEYKTKSEFDLVDYNKAEAYEVGIKIRG